MSTIKYSYQSKVASTANAIYWSEKNQAEGEKAERKEANEFITLSDSWSYAHLIIQLKEAMRENVLIVQFQKANGKVTERKATLQVAHINYESKGSKIKQNPLQVKYYEKDSEKFKSFNITRLKFYKAA